MKKKIVGIFVCMLLIATVLPVSGNAPTINDGTLSGYVNDASMNPIEGVLVRVYFHEAYEEDYTDSTGYYHVTNIPICFCLKNCTASKDGYKTEQILLAINEDTTYDFVLKSSNTSAKWVVTDNPITSDLNNIQKNSGMKKLYMKADCNKILLYQRLLWPKSSISVSSGEDYEVYIGAGIHREEGNGTFGLGWVMTVNNIGDTNISGVFYMKTMTLSGEVICDEIYPFSLAYPLIGVSVGGWTIELIPINFINLSVEIGNKTYSKSGYEIGPFVLLVG